MFLIINTMRFKFLFMRVYCMCVCWCVFYVLLSPVHTVAEKCDCRRKRRDNSEIRRLSHFSATVWTGF